MRLIRLATGFLAVSLFCTSWLGAETHGVSEFEVMGVSLGANQQEVVAGLVKYFSIDAEELVVESDGHIDPLTNLDNGFDRVRYDAGGIELTADFVPDVNAVPPLAVLDRLRVKFKSADLDATLAMTAKEFTDKFGNASYENISYLHKYSWCSVIDNTQTGCADDSASLSISLGIYLKSVVVLLEDPQYESVYWTAYDKMKK